MSAPGPATGGGGVRPQIDYTNKDYAALRQAVLDLARYRLPEWTDRSAADPGSLLIDVLCYGWDVALYYVDRLAAESFLPTATERKSVQDLLRLIGYELRPPTPALAELNLHFEPDAPADEPCMVEIREGTRFATKPAANPAGRAIEFEYSGLPLTIDLNSDQVATLPAPGSSKVYVGLPVRQGVRQSAPLGSSSGEPNQRFRLPRPAPVQETTTVEVKEGEDWVRWEQRQGLLFAPATSFGGGAIVVIAPGDRVFYMEYDESDYGYVCFGDSIFGMIPPLGGDNIRFTALFTDGAVGNVPPRTITELLKPPALPSQLISVTNASAAAGGADHESIEQAVRVGPKVFRSSARAVTQSDYEALALAAGGVARARARGSGGNRCDLYIAPTGPTFSRPPENLKAQLLAYFENRRMVGTTVHIHDAEPVPVNIDCTITVDSRYHPEAAHQAALDAIAETLAYDRMDFGQTLYLSDFYSAIDNAPGVKAANVRCFQRQGFACKVEARIECDEHEIPTLGTVRVTIEQVTPR